MGNSKNSIIKFFKNIFSKDENVMTQESSIIERIRGIIVAKNQWMEVFEIAELLNVHRYEKLIPDDNNSSIGQLIGRYLKKEGFKLKKVKYEKDYSLWVAPPGIDEDSFPEEGYKESELFFRRNEIQKNNNKIEVATDKKPVKVGTTIDEEKTIIECIEKFNGLFGKNGIVRILCGSSSIKDNFYNNDAVNSEFYGIFKHKTQKSIGKIIDKLIADNEILQTGGLRPLLRVPKVDYGEIKTKKAVISEEISINQSDLYVNKFDRSYHEKQLLKLWGFDRFYDNQWSVIEKILNNKRVLIIEKTGFGKSLCYQYPAKLFYEENDGLTLVFSPLLSLMRDQVETLRKIGIKAACINSEQDEEENLNVLKQAQNGEVAILYIAPERLDNKYWQEYIPKIKLSMIVIDEAHCISTWGHDFRPSYRRILNLVNNLPKKFPVLAVTATATNKVAEDIKIQVGEDLEIIRGNLFRDNLHLNVINCSNDQEKMLWILRIVSNLKGNGLIYCGRVADTHLYSEWLKFNNINAIHYNSKIGKANRKIIEKAFFENKYKVIVSTNALGMGIDKPDVRFIIHTQMTENPISYYQEIGRAGRDNLSSQIVLLYNPKDRELAEFFIENSRPHISKYKNAVNLLKKSPMNLFELANSLYLNDDKTDTLINDLIDQNIAIKIGKHYEYRPNAPELDEDYFIWQKQHKLKELDKIIEYINTDKCRMHYLCSYLEDNSVDKCNVCDSCKNLKLELEQNEFLENKVKTFLSEYHLEENLFVNKKKVRVIAISSYGNTEIGTIVHNCKYENAGEFPDFIVDKAQKYVEKNFLNTNLIVYVPPTKSGGLVANFTQKLAGKINIPISHSLKKIRETEPQKVFKSKREKRKNLLNAFEYQEKDLFGKNILVVDDVYDSGVTVETVARHLYDSGAKSVNALVIAKTLKGDD